MNSHSSSMEDRTVSPSVAPNSRVSIHLILNPFVLLTVWVCIGCLFGVQNYAELRSTSYRMTLSDSVKVWSLYTLINGLAFLAIWSPLRRSIQTASWRFLVGVLLPLSIAAGAVVEMVYARTFPFFVHPTQNLTYWARVRADLSGEWLSNVAFFWIAIFLTRSIGYYEAVKVREAKNLQLERELTKSKLRALRMQLNPHFLFNTMNGISGLMREDIDRADVILEQLGQLLRITLDRGDQQLIPLREEIDFILLYLVIQQARFGERLTYRVHIPTQLYDAIVPTMILQPLVENAYAHGIAPSTTGGHIAVSAQEVDGKLVIVVENSMSGVKESKGGRGIGLENVRERLRLHYDSEQAVTLSTSNPGIATVTLSLPLEQGQTSKGLSA